jgi:hypothetical protein
LDEDGLRRNSHRVYLSEWETVDLKASKASIIPNEGGTTNLKFMIRSEPVAYENRRTTVQFMVEILRTLDMTITFTPTVEFLSDDETILATAAAKLHYNDDQGATTMTGSELRLHINEGNTFCKSSEEVEKFPADKGLTMTFFPDSFIFKAEFSDDEIIDANMSINCPRDFVERLLRNTLPAVKKVRFLLDADQDMVTYLGDNVAVKYRFGKRPPE